jgi:hypothetical protein
MPQDINDWEKEFDSSFLPYFFDLHYRFCTLMDKKTNKSCTNRKNNFIKILKSSIRTLLVSQKSALLDKIDEIIREQMRNFANTPLDERQDSFVELGELNSKITKLK